MNMYDKEFKIQLSKLNIDNGVSVPKLSEAYGVPESSLYRWIAEFNKYGDEAFIGSGNIREEDAENKQLKKRISELEMTIEILKKTQELLIKQQAKE